MNLHTVTVRKSVFYARMQIISISREAKAKQPKNN